MTEIYVREVNIYTPAIAAAIGRLMPYLTEKSDGSPTDEPLLREIIKSTHHHQLVAELESESELVLCTASLSQILGANMGRKMYLEDFVSDPNSGVHGAANAVWSKIGEICLQNNAKLRFTSKALREEAHRFYKKRGAQIIDTTVFEKDFAEG